MLLAARAHALREQRHQHVAVAHAVGIAQEALVARQFRTAGDFAELGELAVVADGQDQVSVGGLEDLVGHDVLVRVAGTLRAPRR